MRRQSLYELGHEWRRCRYRTRDPKFIVQYFLRRRQRRLFVINQFCVSIDDAFLILLIINEKFIEYDWIFFIKRTKYIRKKKQQQPFIFLTEY